MTVVLIPSNVNNCISKVAEHHTQYRTTTLFLGSLEATKPEILRQYEIKAILTVASGLEVVCPLGVVHKQIGIEDNSFQNIGQYFSECNEWIKKQLERGNVLVHCRAGISRSASIVVAYTMKTKKIKFLQAVQKIRQARGVIKPNQGFMLQLKQYERKLSKVLEANGRRFK